MVKSPFPWVGGKGKLLWLIHRLFPSKVTAFVDVFGGSGTVLLSRPLVHGVLEVYNDFNSNLTNLMYCIKKRPFALIRELGFLPLNARDEFSVLLKFFQKEKFTDEYLEENLELAEHYLSPPEFTQIRELLLEHSELGDVVRAANYFKLIRYSFNSNTTTFGGRACDIRSFFHLIWKCSERLAKVVIENRDFEALIDQYDRPNTIFYCDPPYYEAEGYYAVEFTLRDHARLHHALRDAKGFVMVSYNDCRFIRRLYRDFYIFRTERPNSMSHTAGSRYGELILTNYDPDKRCEGVQMALFQTTMGERKGQEYKRINKPKEELWHKNNECK